MKYISLGLLAILAVGGCVSESAPDTKGTSSLSISDTQTYDFALPPQELIERVKQTLASMGISVEQQQGGVILTGYKEYPGTWHIARRWQEQTRYRITIFPDSLEPTMRSHLEITSQTQTRADDKDDWHNWAEYQRPQRAQALARDLHEKIQGSAVAAVPNPPPAAPPVATPPPTPYSETVLITYHVIPGKEQQLQQILADLWKLYENENLIAPQPHLVLSDKDGPNQTCIVEIFTWKDHNAPQHVSDSISKLWDQMHQCCQERNGHPGIDGGEVKVVTP